MDGTERHSIVFHDNLTHKCLKILNHISFMPDQRNDIKICGNIIADNPIDLEHKLIILESCPEIDIIHLDYMDGKFVPNKSLDFLESFTRLPAHKRQSSKIYHLHMMGFHPEQWIYNLETFNPGLLVSIDSFLFHVESDNLVRICFSLDLARGFGKPGIAINPGTPVSFIEPLLTSFKRKLSGDVPLVDQVLVMAVKPGQYHAKLIPECLKKAEEIRKIREKTGAYIDIIADGSVNADTVKDFYNAGFNIFSSGSCIMKNPV